MSAADQYRSAEKLVGADPIEAGVIGNLVDHECLHGRLPADPTKRCGCWREEGALLTVVDAGKTPLPPQIAREIRGLCRAGLSHGSIVIVVNRYFNVHITYHQVKYYLDKSGVRRPKIDKGQVIA